MDSFNPNSIGVMVNRSIMCVLTFMSILMSSGVMADEAFSWSNIGGGHSQTVKVLEKIEMLQVLMRDDKIELQSNIANLRMELIAAITEIVTPIGISSQPSEPKNIRMVITFGNRAITPIFQERKSIESMVNTITKARKTLFICP